MVKGQTYCKMVTGTAKGATAGTFDSVGTVTLRSDATEVLAILVSAVTTTTTANEGNSAIVRISSSDLGLANQDFPVRGPALRGPATNNHPSTSIVKIIPFRTKGLAGSSGTQRADIDIYFSSSKPDPTAGYDVAIGILYTNGSVPNDLWDAIRSWPSQRNSVGGKFQDSNDVSGTTSTAVSTTSMAIPAWANKITNICAYPINDAAFAAGEAVIAKYIFRSSIPDFEPQEYPGIVANDASLGTAVIGAWSESLPYYPVHIPLTRRQETVDAYAEVLVAVTGAVAHVASVTFDT